MMQELSKQFQESFKKWLKEFPDQTRAFLNLLQTVNKPGALDTKTKELIAVALSVVAHCKWCIALHVKSALEAGATPEEIMEASWVAVVMNGGPALAYVQLVEKALEEYTQKENQ